MTSLIIHWLIIITLGIILAKLIKPFHIFNFGLVGMIIGVIITYLVHLIIISTQDLIWALSAVSYASFFSGFFASKYTK